ncbi:MAG TPA: alpha/beta hydrolase [bacterium]
MVSWLLCSCSLDSFLFNQKKIDRYDLSTAVIPESNRAMYTFDSEGNTLYGFYTFRTDSLDTGYTVLYCHGNKENIEEYWDRVELFYKMGIRCFIFDYRGYGRSEGTPSASGLYADGRAALDYVVNTLHADTTRLFFYGYSLGNVVSIDLAAASAHSYPLCLIAEAPFASGEALFHTATPLDLPGSFVIDDNMDNASRIRAIHTPYLQLHGDADDYVPWQTNGRLVYENAPPPKTLDLIHDATHTNVPQTMGFENYAAAIRNFLLSSTPH